ncbi:hypothetical protein AGOR_G00016560 [Albula goreensis]|uniref:Uncharacterized protein n=1 Tax=Albula goreensis TaxID=1534307 RepID=A0A8T3E8P2_9TELE|nr:hypothetical protein AGOR_G00016560 [Albula goreensis]
MDGHNYDRYGDGERDTYQIDYRRIVGDTSLLGPDCHLEKASTISTARSSMATPTDTDTRPQPNDTAPRAFRPAMSLRGEPPGLLQQGVLFSALRHTETPIEGVSYQLKTLQA